MFETLVDVIVVTIGKVRAKNHKVRGEGMGQRLNLLASFPLGNFDSPEPQYQNKN